MKDHKTKAAPIALCSAQLAQMPPGVLRPTYDRSKITPGIIHIGLGNFHRAHQAWYLHRLMEQGKALDWGIIGAGVRDYDEAQRQKLAAQDYLSTLIELDPSGVSAEIVGSMIGYIPVEAGNRALIQRMADPAIRIVSLTVTEGGYYIDPATKQFDPTHPDIVFDRAHPDTPRTAFGAIVAGLKIRRDAGHLPFTCQSCDNLPGNGDILRQVTLGLARLMDPDLADWIEEEASFPNSMVDCIVPASGPDESALVQSLGVLDRAPVTHENFRQWVIEDSFCVGRPEWEQVGATMSDKVHDYEAMKLRILNGGHQIIAAPAELLGHTTIADAMAIPEIKAYLCKVAINEIGPHVRDVPGMDVTRYVDLVEKRFSNAAIRDTVRRVAFDGSSRHTGAVLPAIRDAIARNTSLDGLALSQALWAKMCAGLREDGSVIAPNDPVWEALHEAAAGQEAWLEQGQIYGALAQDPRFKTAFFHWADVLRKTGVLGALRAYLGSA
ncbi:MAG: mannitol dehydrogenase family protein [Pseudomonadota bacterium]